MTMTGTPYRGLMIKRTMVKCLNAWFYWID
jgi:hypothetical protein